MTYKSTFRIVLLGVWTCISFLDLYAQFNHDSLRHEVNKWGQDTNKVLALNKLSHAYRRINYDSAVLLSRDALALATKLDFVKGIAYSYHNMGNAFNNQGEFDSAEVKFQSAIDLYGEMGDRRNVGKMYNNLSLVKRYQGSYSEAVEYLMEYLRLMKEFNDKKGQAMAYQNIGIVFAIQGEYETAEGYIKDAIDIYEANGDSSKFYGAFIDFSSLKRDQGKYDEALVFLKKAYSYHIRTGNSTSVAICTYNMGFASYSKNDLDQSLKFFFEAKKLFSDLGNGQRTVGCYVKISEIQLEKLNYNEAIRTAKEGLIFTKKGGSSRQIYRLHKVLSKSYAGKNQFNKAYHHNLEYIRLKDSITGEKQRVKLLSLQNKYEKEVNSREIEELKIENERNELKSRRQDTQNYILWGLIGVILVVALLLFNQYTLKQKNNKTLQEKNTIIQHSLEEKEVLLREIHHRVQNNLQFVSSMLNLQARRVQDEQTLEILKGSKARIQSMALVHQKLYQENSLKGINISNYVQNLLESLRGSYNIDSKNVIIDLTVEPIILDLNSAISIGLILNELITNAFKYAFQDDISGKLRIALSEVEHSLYIDVHDNGPGLSEDFNIEDSNSFGLKLVHSLAKKVNATIEITSEAGTRVQLKIKNYNKV